MSGRPGLVIWGASGHALTVADIVRREDRFTVVGFLDDIKPERAGERFAGSEILGGRQELDGLRKRGLSHLIVAVGDRRARESLADEARRHGFELATAVHPAATLAEGVEPGAGTVVMAGAVVNPGTRVGENVIINTRAGVDHDCTLCNGVHVAPGAVLGGWVTLGAGAWIGIGAVVRDRVTVGPGTLVGAGAVVLSDLPADVVAYGVPARVIRKTS
jgi:sugar O-acyltransferase (sialic acid O-acetyltransferase NeuD family)